MDTRSPGLRRAALCLLPLLTAACATSIQGETALVLPSASQRPSQVIPTPSPTVAPTPIAPRPSPTPVAADPLRDQIVAVVTTDLVVRSEPGTGAESEIYGGTLSAPITVYVIDGPVAANGYDWYLVDPVRVDWSIWGGPPAGWVAAAGKDGERWLASTPEQSACDSAPTLSELVVLPPQVRLYCWADDEMSHEGVVDRCVSVTGGPFGHDCAILPVGSEQPAGCADCTAPYLRSGLWGSLAPPPNGSTIRFTGRFDGPACRGYTGTARPEDLYPCRVVFAVTELTVVASN